MKRTSFVMYTVSKAGRYIVPVLFALCITVGFAFGMSSAAIAECEHRYTKEGDIEYGYQYYHSFYHYVLRKVPILCDDCGQFLQYIDRLSYLEEHTAGSNGICTKCGSSTSTECTHSKTYWTMNGDGILSQDATETQHKVSHIYSEFCEECGYFFGIEYRDFWWEDHSFTRPDGSCGCGYKKPSCSHTATKKEYLRSEYEQIAGNDQKHRVIDHNRVVCADCGKVMNSDQVDYWNDNHSFNTNNQCTACGYQKLTCTHERTTYKDYVSESEYAKHDEEQHYRTRYYNLVCSKCKAVVDENLKEEKLENHLFDNLGNCSYCDYSDISKCRHWKIAKAIIEKQSYRKYTTTEHSVKGIGTKTCENCDVVIDENAEVEVTEYHTFNMDGICIYCEQQIGLFAIDETFSGGIGAMVFPKEGGTGKRKPQGFFISAWTASTNVDWITLHTTSGSSGDSLQYTVAENNSARRTGYIIFDCDYAGYMYAIIIQDGIAEENPQIHPTLSGFSVTPTTVNLGDSIAVSGTVNGNGAKLTAVSIGVRNYSNQALGGYWGHSTNLYADSFDLSSYGPLTLDGNFGNTSFNNGQWIVEVYATTEDGLGFATSQTKIITVNNPQPAGNTPVKQPNAACNHVYGYDYADVSDGEWQSINDDYHKRVTVLYKDVCTLCGDVRYQRRADEAAVQEKHTWGQTNWAKYHSDANEHWRLGKRPCTAPGCSYIDNVVELRTPHTFVDGKCVCGYEYKYDCNLEGHIDDNTDLLCDMCLSFLAFSNRLSFRMENENPAFSMVYMQLMETGVFDRKYITEYSQYVQGLEAIGNLSIKDWIESNPNMFKFHSIKMNEAHAKEIVAKLYIDYIYNFDAGEAMTKFSDAECLELINEIDKFIPAFSATITTISNGETILETIMKLDKASSMYDQVASTAVSVTFNVTAEAFDRILCMAKAKIVRVRLEEDIGGIEQLPEELQKEMTLMLDVWESTAANMLELGATALDSIGSSVLSEVLLTCPILKVAHGALSIYTTTTNYDEIGAGLEDIYAIKIMTERASEAFTLSFENYQQNPTAANYREFVKQKNAYRSYLTVGAATYRDWCIAEAPSEFDLDFWNHDEKTKKRIDEANLVYENELRKIDSYFSLFD